MKLNNLQKNLFISFFVFFTILLCTLLWGKIYFNVSNITGAVGSITEKNYSTDSDTLRYVMFISLPLLVYFFLNFIFKKSELIDFKELFTESERKSYQNELTIYFLIIIFFCFIIFEFLSLNLPNGPIDTFHDGEILVPAQNYFLKQSFFLSSYTVHGGSDIFYPVITWKIFNTESVGAARTFFTILIFLLKLLCIFLSYQFTKITPLKKEIKVIFFIIFSISLLSMSYYQAPINFSYLSYRDFFLVLFLIFFIELFTHSRFKVFSTILVAVIASFAFLFHFDTGIFLNVTLALYGFYLLIIKKYFDIFIIFISIIITWLLIISFLGLDEFKAFIDNAITIVFSMDYMHGTMYPEPFFSMKDNPDGARATRGLMLQISAGIFVIYNVINRESKFSSQEKIFFIFLFFLSFIMYKNALGRSDSYHIRMSHDLPILINIFFIFNFIFYKIEKNDFLNKFLLSKNYFPITALLIFLIIITNQFKFNVENIKNLRENYSSYISLKDENFLENKLIKFISFYKKISKDDYCVENFTYDQILPYLMKKPTCTKYSSPWIASPLIKQDDYIKQLKASNPNFIIYKSGPFHMDYIPMTTRLKKVNEHIRPIRTISNIRYL